MKRLGILLDAVVAIRQMGGGKTPDPLHVISMLEMAGVDSIVYTMMQTGAAEERDLRMLKETIHSHFNLRLVPTMENAQAAIQAKAEMVTMIDRDSTSIRSVNAVEKEALLAPIVSFLRTNGIVVNMLVDTDANQLRTAARMGCDYVELNTDKYTGAASLTLMEQELENMKAMAMAAKKLTLSVTLSGHINHNNIRELLDIEEIEEINIGHSVFARALFVGLDQAVRDFATLIKK
ncbi:MAG TPA: pyridoxine 5'-phosphate synthase [bacterium]|nr:pyridoxine 5'-phosphate synthase [bacterium]HMW32735.1 pyridoxine 5'-phosphate synthase [bacterium]HMW35432.1 pyridoxine 5'-phosphate synthase [bacterium]HMY34549.1 pyridoxine 5'-phosphate synthase [bacterium]HMZ03322.1 pyridoxine 5'-phosphate synthase [bacterium]